MTTPSTQEITQLLADWGGGDPSALEKLTPLVYAELRRIARRQMRDERPGHTLQATALVNEAFLRLDEADVVFEGEGADELVALDEAQRGLEEVDPRKASVVELRYFAGLSTEETAEVLGVSPTTVRREWRRAKAWLYRAIAGGEAGDEV